MTIVNAILNGNPANVNYAIDFIRNNLRTILKSYVLCVSFSLFYNLSYYMYILFNRYLKLSKPNFAI